LRSVSGAVVGHTGAMESLRSGHRTRWLVVLGVVGIAVYSWVAAGLRPFTIGEEVMVAIPALVVFAAAWRPTRKPPVVRWSRTSVALWLGVVVLAVGWELLAYLSSPREDHPTLSVIADEIMSVHAGRALLFLLWLWLGWLFVRSPRVAGQ
jgi:hypothetical protein